MTAQTLPFTATFTLPTPASNKAEEQQFLKDLAAALPENTYMKSLFSEALVGWVCGNIADDFSPDIMDTLEERTAQMRGNEKQAEMLRAELRAQQAEEKRSSEEHQEAIKSLLTDLDGEYKRAERNFDRMMKAEARACELEELTAKLNRQVADLKAELFDAYRADGRI